MCGLFSSHSLICCKPITHSESFFMSLLSFSNFLYLIKNKKMGGLEREILLNDFFQNSISISKCCTLIRIFFSTLLLFCTLMSLFMDEDYVVGLTNASPWMLLVRCIILTQKFGNIFACRCYHFEASNFFRIVF